MCKVHRCQSYGTVSIGCEWHMCRRVGHLSQLAMAAIPGKTHHCWHDMRRENVCYFKHPATLCPETPPKLYHEFNLETNVDKKEKMHRYDIICVSAHKQSGCEFHNKSDNDTWNSDIILIKIILL